MKRFLSIAIILVIIVSIVPINAAAAPENTGWQYIDDQWYFYNNKGVAHKGWLNSDGARYYFRSDGTMVTGWLQLKKDWYYFHESGAMATGWLETDDTWYYLHSKGAMAKGWLDQDGVRYYLRDDGSMATGWLQFKKDWYYFKDGGAMAANERVFADGAWHSINSKGVWKTLELPLRTTAIVSPVITSNVKNRSPQLYRDVVGQFGVETAERYRPGRDGYTYCNIFVLDVTRAMDVYVPHLGAIKMCEWLGSDGAKYGWRKVDAATAQMYANQGRPAVTGMGSRGHVQMVVPSANGLYNSGRGATIAQAGTRNTSYAYITDLNRTALSDSRINYYVHD